jgi:hypothetical protein
MTTTQYRLYDMTEPYVALFCHPNNELKIPQPPSPFSSGEQHCHSISIHPIPYSTREKTYINMPNTLPNIITPRSRTRFRCALARQLDPSILLEVPNAFGKQTRGNEIQETR